MKNNKISNKDYFYLAKKSLKSRKKSTRTTVRGIAFGLILILPVLFFTFAYYLDFNTKINKVESVSILNITTEHKEGVEPTRKSGWQPILNNSVIKTVDGAAKPKERVVYERYRFNTYNYAVSINGGEKAVLNDIYSDHNFNNQYNNSGVYKPSSSFGNISFLSYNESQGKLTTDSIMSDLNLSQPIIEGSNFTASTRGKGEMLVTKSLLTNYNLKVGDTMSMYYTGDEEGSANSGIYVDNDNIVGNPYIRPTQNNGMRTEIQIFADFKIVGVINDRIYSHERNKNLSNFIMTDASLYSENGIKYAPTLRNISLEESNGYAEKIGVATYTKNVETLAEDAINNGTLALLLGYGFGYFDNNTGNTMLYQTQYASYGDCTKAIKTFESVLKSHGIEAIYVDSLNMTSVIFSSMQVINQISVIVIAVFLVFGGVILLATLINLYNSIQYSVEARRNYMGMLRAIGAKDASIYRMYFSEILLIFLRALIWISIIGGAISIGIKFGLDALFRYTKDFFPIALTLNLWYLPIVLGGIFLFSLGIAWIYSRISCRGLANKPILGLLKEDR